MNRYQKNKQDVYIPKKKKVEVSDKHLGLKLAITIALIVIALVSFGIGIKSCKDVASGWSEITAAIAENYGDEFTFYYDLGIDQSATVENKEISALYKTYLRDYYLMFSPYDETSEINNIYYLNHHVNEVVTIDKALYNALKEVTSSTNPRILFMGPVYNLYINIFQSTSDVDAAYYNPETNSEIKSMYDKMISYLLKPDHISLEFYDNYQVKLNVSTEYQMYLLTLDDSPIYLDFMYLKNAFIVDLIADAMIDNGYKHGLLVSNDGMRRIFAEDEEVNSVIYDYYNNEVNEAATTYLSGYTSYVTLKKFSVGSFDEMYYYQYSNGTFKSSYLSYGDYSNTQCVNSLTCYSTTKSCSEIILKMLDIYLTKNIDNEAVNNLISDNIYSYYLKGLKIYYNDQEVAISYSNESEVGYVKEYIGE